MATVRSRLTSQGQVSVPAAIRRHLGLHPGSVIEWHQEGDGVVVRRAALYGWEDVRKAAFPNGPPRRRSLKELKRGISDYIRQRHGKP
jgi:antitoxin PrlF